MYQKYLKVFKTQRRKYWNCIKVFTFPSLFMTKSFFIVVYANMYFSIIRLEICVFYFPIKKNINYSQKSDNKIVNNFWNGVRRLSLSTDFAIPSPPLSIYLSRCPLPGFLYIPISLPLHRLSLSTYPTIPILHFSCSTDLSVPSMPLSIYFSR